MISLRVIEENTDNIYKKLVSCLEPIKEVIIVINNHKRGHLNLSMDLKEAEDIKKR